VTKEGRPFTITTPDFCLALVEFDYGVVARLTANFYVAGSYQAGSIEIHGDAGRVWLQDFQNFGGHVKAADYGKPYEDIPLVRPQEKGIEFGRGIDEMARAMLEGRPQRATGAHAAHVCEIVVAIERSASEGKPVALTSTFPQPQPIDFAALSPFTPKA
jgi:predicted dehydrogenase